MMLMATRMSVRSLLFALCLFMAAQPVEAQIRLEVLPEVRADLILGKPDAIHVGGGFVAPLGLYTRLGLIGGVGVNDDGASGRMDAIARFHVDPFRQAALGLFAGGGLSARFDNHRETRAYLLGFLGIEGPSHRDWVPAIEVGFGGGARIGVAFRKGARERR
jgi:hypothetical protein